MGARWRDCVVKLKTVSWCKHEHVIEWKKKRLSTTHPQVSPAALALNSCKGNVHFDVVDVLHSLHERPIILHHLFTQSLVNDGLDRIQIVQLVFQKLYIFLVVVETDGECG